MKKNFGSDKKPALEAKMEAQKLAFAPLMFQAAKALRDLGILERLKEGKGEGVSAAVVAADLEIPEYGVKVLLDAGLSIGIVMLQDEKYILTKTGFFILTDTMTRVNMDFVNDVCYKPAFWLEESVRKGTPEGLKEFGDWPTVYEGLSELPDKVQESWFNFDHYYSDLVFPEALPIVFDNAPGKILDVGGNTGKWAIQCCRFDEQVKVTIVDLPGQLNVAYSHIRAQGLKDRIDGYEMNVLDPDGSFPKGYDVIWMSQFLDCFAEDEILRILEKAKEAMDKGSCLYILETYWDRQKYEASTYSLNATSLYFTCVANGNSRMYHSEDMKALISRSGLYVEKEFELLGVSHSLYRCRKA